MKNKENVEYSRDCPNCKIKIITKNKYWNEKAIKENRLCLSCANKSHIITDEWKQNMSKNHADVIGMRNPFFGKKHSEKTKEILRKANVGKNKFSDEYKQYLSKKMTGDGNNFYGKTHSEKTKEILSKPKTEEHKRKLALALKGNSSSRKGKFHTDESKRKMRISAIKRMSKYKFDGISMCPNVNKKETEYFTNLEKEKKWNGIFFGKENKKTQYLIESLGYFVDYYEPNKNVVVEYDETNHYDSNWILKEKDIKRQNEIIKTLQCSFYRYNEVLNKLYEVTSLNETNS